MRNIETEYFDHRGRSVHRNYAKHARAAVWRAVDHMQVGHYQEAFCAIVWDLDTAELHSVITHSVIGKIEVVLHRDLYKPVCLVAPLPEKELT